MEAAMALVEGVTPETTTALQSAISDSSEVVRAAAMRSLLEAEHKRRTRGTRKGPDTLSDVMQSMPATLASEESAT
jgi:hypothetical protein